MSSKIRNRLAITLLLHHVYGVSAPAYSQETSYSLEVGPFTSEEAPNVCRKKGSGWGTVDAEDSRPKQAKISLPQEVFLSVTEGDNMFVVVVDTKSWKNRDPKPGEKFGVVCEFFEARLHALNDTESEKQINNYHKDREEKLLQRAEKFFANINGRLCQRAKIIEGYTKTFYGYDGLTCLPSILWKQAMDGPWIVSDISTGGWKQVMSPDNPTCASATPIYTKEALEAVKYKINQAPAVEGIQPMRIDETFLDQLEKNGARPCTKEEEVAWDNERRRKVDAFHFGKHK